MGKFFDNLNLEEILHKLSSIEERLSKIESTLNIIPPKPEEEVLPIPAVQPQDEELEFRIGQFWAAKIGIVVLIIGFAFLLTLPYENLPAVLPSIVGYFCAVILFGLARLWRQSFSHLSGYLVGGGFVLLYLATMRLYFFTTDKALESFPLILSLLIVVTILSLIISVYRDSSYLALLGLILGYATAVLSDYSYFIFIVNCALAATVVLFKLKYNWNSLLFYGMFLTYLTHLLWFINNPLIGNIVQTVSEPELNVLFILLYVLIFSYANLATRLEAPEDFTFASSSLMNSSGGYGLLLLITLLSTPAANTNFQFASAVVLLGTAITFWLRQRSKYSTFFYAMFGYVAFSVAIIGQFEKPDYFIWLCWQSLLVISTAVWFRSKFIVLANFVIFLVIFAAYLIMGDITGGISISFGLVALFSARILNWKKDQLELKTEQMRNAYLLSALFIIPYSLYQMFPSGYVSLTWIGIAIVYYILSILLKNKKYRWMALATYFLTVVYVFILGITSTETVFKIISFLVLGSALIIISLVYTKNKGKTKTEVIDKHESDG